MKPLTYDFPDRLRGLSSARRELRRLELSMTVAYHRGDKFALDYLTRRHNRATQAVATLCSRLQRDATPPGDPETASPPGPAGMWLAVPTPEFSEET